MSYKVYLYVFTTLLSIYTLNGINYTNFFKKNREIEAKIFFIIISLCMSYLLTNFIYDFIEVSKII